MRKVIKYAKPQHMNAVAKMNKARILVDEFKAAYVRFQDDTEMPDLTKDSIMAIMDSGRTTVERMIDSYVAKQKKPLQKYYAEACYKALADHLDSVLKEISYWKTDTRPTSEHDVFPHELIYPSNWPWTNELALRIDNEFEERIKPLFETTIESEIDHRLLEKYETLAKAYNDLMEFADQYDVRIPRSFKTLFKMDSAVQVGKNEIVEVDRVRTHPEVFLPSQTRTWYNQQMAEALKRR